MVTAAILKGEVGRIVLNRVCGHMQNCLFDELDPAKKKCVNQGKGFCAERLAKLSRLIHES
ncbi:MAG: hypothetical protein WC831_06000 [Parcubacteria group bacterium]|jgi:hypothetical protein